VGGTYKNGVIELSGEKVPEVTKYLDSKQIKWKKVGG
jgi:translation initiation factor 1 (eIF-1/SUI1)